MSRSPTPDRPQRLRARDPRPFVGAVALTIALGAAACASPTPIPPVAPGWEPGTPVGMAGGLLPTATDTPGPSPTPVPVATFVTPPPEPLQLPDKFGIAVYAEGIPGARMMALAPNGDLFVTVPRHDQVLVLPDRNADGVADTVQVFAQGEALNQPNGLGFWDGFLYVADTDGLVRIPYTPGDLQASAPPETVVALPGEGLNPLHSLTIGLDGDIYVGVGSSCDACVEQDGRRASVVRVAPDGSAVVLFATGLRHPAGLAVHPDTGAVWVTDDGREGLGQDRPPEELNVLSPGANFGWPFCFGDRLPDPTAGGDRARCETSVAPAVEFVAHSAPHGVAFYTGKQFPAEYVGGAFVALHGTYDAYLPTGSSIVFLPFAGGQPTGGLQGFIQGWLQPDTRRWAIPVDVTMAPDGGLLVSDEGGGRIYRVFYTGPRPTATPYP
jgi:glucose/arabinose dehydrogenase